MADRKSGSVIFRQDLSPALAIFRLAPEPGSVFPDYRPGQYIALRRENCRLTRKIVGADGVATYHPDLDERGVQRRGPVAHPYSISSAPFETREHGFLEFYVLLESSETGVPGRLTESLWQVEAGGDDRIIYIERITGQFTLDTRAAGYRNVVLVGTGTGLAPFASMVKQLHYEAVRGHTDGVRYTLIHANRTLHELGYHDQFEAIERAGDFDFVYIGSVSRPTPRDAADSTLAKGRANNLLRLILGRPMKEEDDLADALSRGDDLAPHRAALAGATPPVLPGRTTAAQLRERMPPADTVLLFCGSPRSMTDTQRVAETARFRFEKEAW